MKAWHYTTAQKFQLIKASGLLLPSDIGVSYPELPILWFSTHQQYEPTALKPLSDGYGTIVRMLSVRELREYAGGLVRFGMSTDTLKRGDQLRKAARMSATIWRKLELAGKRMKGNPSDWYGHVGSMSLDQVTLEVLDENMVWHPL